MKMKDSMQSPTTTRTTTRTPDISSGGATNTLSNPSIISGVAVTKYEKRKRQERMERFAACPSHNPTKNQQQQQQQQEQPTPTKETATTDEVEGITAGPYYDIIGRNMEIEKSYLRLTTYPKCEDVRPLPILIKALVHVKRKYQQNDDLDWCNDQLKSIRQDITVQKSHIPTNHTLILDVYQTHARILLEHGQLSEFNQCLSNVLQIYDALQTESIVNRNSRDNISNGATNTVNNTGGIARTITTTCSVKKAEGEFRAYSILYSLVQSKTTFFDLNIALRRRLQQHRMWTQQPHVVPRNRQRPTTKSKTSKKGKKRHRSSSTTIISDVSNDHPTNYSYQMMNCISAEEQYAWDVVQSIYDGQYTKFFMLYDAAPHMSPYILDFLLHRVRLQAYHVLMASYRSSLSIVYVQQALHFDTLEEVHHFLQQRGTVFVSSTTSNDGNGSSIKLNDTASIEHLFIDCRQSQLTSQSPNS
jgi:hypothetical protein